MTAWGWVRAKSTALWTWVQAKPSELRAKWSKRRIEQIDFKAVTQFAASIRSELKLLSATNAPDPNNPRPEWETLMNEITCKLDAIKRDNLLEQNWSDAYHAEKLLLALLPPERVRVELGRRAQRLKQSDAPFAEFYRDAVAAAVNQNGGNADALRLNLLVSMVDDVQTYTSDHFIRIRYASIAVNKVGLVFSIAFVIFLGALTWGHWLAPGGVGGETSATMGTRGSAAPDKSAPPATDVEKGETNVAILFPGWIYVSAAGLFGATFFMLIELQNRLASSRSSELRDAWTFRLIGLRCAVGIGAATILYFFFQTDLLGDAGVWPKLSNISFEAAVRDGEWHLSKWFTFNTEFRFPNRDTSLLLIWGFLAGYTQNLVPSILTRTSKLSAQNGV